MKQQGFNNRHSFSLSNLTSSATASSETQGQIVGARESLNGRENMARRKVRKGEKIPWGSDQFQTVCH